MKLKCVCSNNFSNKLFIEGNIYEAKAVGDGDYSITTEKGNNIQAPLSGTVWKFEILESKQEQEDIIFEIESLIKQLNDKFDKLKNLME